MSEILKIIAVLVIVILMVPAFIMVLVTGGGFSGFFGVIVLVGAVVWLRSDIQRLVLKVSSLEQKIAELEESADCQILSKYAHTAQESAQPISQPSVEPESQPLSQRESTPAITFPQDLSEDSVTSEVSHSEPEDQAYDIPEPAAASLAMAFREEAIHEPLDDVEDIYTSEPTLFDRVFAWLSVSWPLKLGAFLVLLATGWFFSVAFANNWIVPSVRILMGLALGAGLMVGGFVWMKTQLQKGAIFLVVGASTILMTLFAAYAVFELLTSPVTLFLMFLTTAFVAYVSGLYRIKSLSYLSLLTAFAVPILVSGGEPNIIGLFVYLLIVLMGNVGLSVWSRTPGLVSVSGVCLGVYSIGVFGQAPQPLPLIIAAQALVLYVTSVLFIWDHAVTHDTEDAEDTAPSNDSRESMQAGFFGVMTTMLWIVGWIVTTVPEQLQVLSILALLAVCTATGLALYHKTLQKNIFYVFSFVSMSLLLLATIIQFEGFTLIGAISLQFAVMAVITQLITKDIRMTQQYSGLMIIPAFLTIYSVASEAWAEGVFHGPFWSLVLFTGIMGGLAAYTYLPSRKYQESEEFVDDFPMHTTVGLFNGCVVGVQLLLMLILNAVLVGTVLNSGLLLFFIIGSYITLSSAIYQRVQASYYAFAFVMFLPLFLANFVDQTSAFIYIFVVGLGCLWVSYLTSLSYHISIGMIFTFIISLRYFGETSPHMLVFLILIGLLYFVTSTFQLYRYSSSTGDEVDRTDLVAGSIGLAVHALWVACWTLTTAPEIWHVWLLLALTLVYGGIGVYLFGLQQSRKVFFLFSTLSLSLLILVTMVQFDGVSFLILLAVELAIMPILVQLLFEDIELSQRYSYLMAIPIFFSVPSFYSLDWSQGVLHDSFWNILIVGLLLLGLGVALYAESKKSENDSVKYTNAGLLILGSIYWYALLWQTLQASPIPSAIGILIALTVYTIIGIICYIYGVTTNHIIVNRYGGIMIGCVILRLVLVDVWSMDIIPRVATFFVIGILLMSTAFVNKLNTPNIES